MKIYVSDDIYEYLTIGKRDIHSGVDVDFVVKSLDQHDAEVRADEKKKWQDKFDELEKYIKEMSYEVTASVGGFDYLVVDFEDLQQKLAELEKTPQGKGEKDE